MSIRKFFLPLLDLCDERKRKYEDARKHIEILRQTNCQFTWTSADNEGKFGQQTNQTQKNSYSK